MASVLPGAAGCSTDSSVDFTPLEGQGGRNASVAGAANSSTGSTHSGGGTANGGSGSNQAGSTSLAGTSGGGADGNGGKDSGGNAGTANGGMAGSESGGTGGNAGAPTTGGMAGGGMSGSAGAMGGNATGGGPPSCDPHPEICDGVDNDCDDQVDPPTTCPDGCTGSLFEGHRYIFCGQVANVDVAATTCDGANMNGLAIESSAENEFVLASIEGPTWLAGSDDGNEGVWRWASNDQIFWNKGKLDGTYQNWQGGEPNNFAFNEDCLIIAKSNVNSMSAGKWNDQPCDAANFRVACEAEAP